MQTLLERESSPVTTRSSAEQLRLDQVDLSFQIGKLVVDAYPGADPLCRGLAHQILSAERGLLRKTMLSPSVARREVTARLIHLASQHTGIAESEFEASADIAAEADTVGQGLATEAIDPSTAVAQDQIDGLVVALAWGPPETWGEPIDGQTAIGNAA